MSERALDPVEVAEIRRRLEFLALDLLEQPASRLYGYARQLLDEVERLQAAERSARPPLISEVPRLGSVEVRRLDALPANTILCSGDVFERLYAAIGGLDQR